MQRCNQSLALFRAQGDARWCGDALNSLGVALFDQRALAAARSAIEEGLALFRQVGGARSIALALGNLGDVARAEGDHARRRRYSPRAWNRSAGLEDAWGSSLSLQSLALVASARGEPIRAARLFGAAEAQREVAAVPLPPADRPEHDRAVANDGACDSAATRSRRPGRRPVAVPGSDVTGVCASGEREPARIAAPHPRIARLAVDRA